MQRLRPTARAEIISRQLAIDLPHRWSSRRVVFHREHRAVENPAGIVRRGRRDESRLCPDFGLVVLADRRHGVGRDAEEPRREAAPCRNGRDRLT